MEMKANMHKALYCILMLAGLVPVVMAQSPSGSDANVVYALDWHPDGTRIAVGSSNGVLQVINATTQQVEATLHGHTGDVLAVEWRPDGTQLASGAEDATVILWNDTGNQPAHTLNT
ncbi:MAG: hypothetical protein AAF787_22940, partial [Chloroflexota bacterium]